MTGPEISKENTVTTPNNNIGFLPSRCFLMPGEEVNIVEKGKQLDHSLGTNFRYTRKETKAFVGNRFIISSVCIFLLET